MSVSRGSTARRNIPATGSIFAHVLVGVDGTEAGFEACRQAALLADPEAAIDAVAVVHLADAVLAGMDAPHVADALQRDAEAALDEAVRILGSRARRRFVNGLVSAALLDEAERSGATVIALGSHGHHRITEILIGGVAGDVLHRAPCSMLVARPPGGRPAVVVVGLDGSPAAEAALAAARQVGERLRLPVRVVVAGRGKGVDLDRVRLLVTAAEVVGEHPVDALVDASREAAVVVVGSRGLHGVRALGSVSERVAHQAACSVVVVRARREA